MRPYADRMTELMVGTARASTSLQGLALLQRREVKKVAIVPLTGDRGLAGAFNAQVLRHAFALERQLRGDGVEVHWLVAGKKGRSTLGFRRYEIDQSWIGLQRPARLPRRAGDRPHRLAELYANGEVDRVVIVYNQFVSALVQRVVERDLLPIPEEALAHDEDEEHEEALLGDFIYEPEPEEILAAAAAGLRRDRALPRAARVGRLRAGRADDGDAQRLRQRRRPDREPDAGHEPRPPGGDHAGDPRGRRRRRRPRPALRLMPSSSNLCSGAFRSSIVRTGLTASLHGSAGKRSPGFVRRRRPRGCCRGRERIASSASPKRYAPAATGSSSGGASGATRSRSRAGSSSSS